MEGDRALAASLFRVASELDSLDRAGQIGGQAIRNRAMSAAPVRTGALVRSIRAEATGTEINVAAGAPYAGFNEYGTRHMPAHPFMRPALEANTETVVNAYTAEIQQLLNTVKGA